MSYARYATRFSTRNSKLETRNSRASQRVPAARPEVRPVDFVGGGEAVPEAFVIRRERLHVAVKRGAFARDGAQVIAVRLMPGETDDVAVAQLSQNGDVSLTDCAAPVAAVREPLGFGQEIGSGLFGRESLAQDDARLAPLLIV